MYILFASRTAGLSADTRTPHRRRPSRTGRTGGGPRRGAAGTQLPCGPRAGPRHPASCPRCFSLPAPRLPAAPQRPPRLPAAPVAQALRGRSLGRAGKLVLGVPPPLPPCRAPPTWRPWRRWCSSCAWRPASRASRWGAGPRRHYRPGTAPRRAPRGRPGRRRSPRGRAGAGAARSPPALLGGGRASARGLRCPGARAGPCGFLQLPLAPRVPRRGLAAPFMACRWGGAAPSTALAGRAAPLGFATGCLGWAGKWRLRCQANGVRRLGRSWGATGPCRARGALSKPHAQGSSGDAAVESL